MLSKRDKERLRQLAENATPGPRRLRPRSVWSSDKVEAGADPITVAAEAADDDYLGWEIDYGAGFVPVGRGDFAGPDAAFIMATPPEAILALLNEIESLKYRLNN